MVTAARIVGRDDVLTEIADVIGLADPTTPGTVLLGGDAGIGKTRVVTEIADRARQAGTRVLIGRCVDLGDNPAAYAPVSEIMIGLDSTERAGLVEQYPALAALTGDSGTDTSWLRADVFAAIGRAMERLADADPLLVVFEDVHWADPSTRHLVHYLLTRTFAVPVSFLVTFRSDDLHRRHRLRPALAEWTRLPNVHRVDLLPLADDAMITLLRSRDVRIVDVATIVERAAGNAFYAEELRDAGLSDGALPADLAELLLVRFDRLSAAAQTAARAVSCSAAPVDDALLRQVLEPFVGAECDAALREAVDQLVLAPVGDAFGFRHALLGEAVHDDMLPGERRAMHASFLKALPDSAAAAAVAHHAYGAAELSVAFDAGVQAAHDAERAGGYDEAAAHYQRALDIFEHATGDVDLSELVVRAADALVSCGRLRTAASLTQSYLDQADPGIDYYRLLYTRARIDHLLQMDPGTASLVALANTTDVPDELAARFLALRAVVASHRGDDDEAGELAERALQLAVERGEHSTASEAQIALLRVAARRGRADEKITARYADVVAAAREQGDVFVELRALHRLAVSHLDRGDLAEAALRFNEMLNRSKATGLEWAPYGFDGRFFSAVVAYIRGDWDAVLGYREGTAGATRLVRACLGAIAMLVQAGRGEPAAAEDVDAARARWDNDQYPLALHSGTALIDLAADADEAILVHDELLVAMEKLWQNPYGPYRLRTSGLLLGRLCEAAGQASQRERTRFARIGANIAEDAELAAARASWLGAEGVAWSARCRAEYARLRWLTGEESDVDHLVELWTEAVNSFTTYQQPYEVARSATRLAQVLTKAGRSQDAVPFIETAREIATRLRAAPELAALDALKSAGTKTELTAREGEVLKLVADGRTNGDIAKQLFISTKTASVHVSNILAKLGASSRTEAAALARRDGFI